MEEENTLTQGRIATHKSVNVSLYFNEQMDDGEVRDFIERALEKYQSNCEMCHFYRWYTILPNTL
jgi:hypothetical protein